MARLRGERRVFDAYNKHRLGQAAFRYYEASLGEDIEEDLENFPLRFQVVESGFPELTDDLLPIFQAADYETGLASNAQITAHVPVGPANATSKSTQPGTQPGTPGADKGYDKLQGSPVPNLDFPTGNITLAELAAFHPQALKSFDMIDRFCGNGGSQATFAVMINHFRKMDRGLITGNSVYRLMKGPMTLRGKLEDPRYATWTSGKHDQFHDAANFDPTSVSVTGFRTAADGKIRTSAAPIPLKDMANGVKVFPTGDDALDLARAVAYCQNHPDEQWIYPTDFQRLLKERLGGPAKVKPAHHDGAVIDRYTSNRIALGVSRAKGRKRDSHGRLQKVESDEEEEDISMTDSLGDDIDFEAQDKKRTKRKDFFDDDSVTHEHDTTFRKHKHKVAKTIPESHTAHNTSRRTPAPSRLRKSFLADDINSDSDGDAFHGPKKSEKAIAPARRSLRATKVTQTYDVETFGAYEDEDEASRAMRKFLDSESDEDAFEDED
ncbi:hypothetical protein DE146DRAFT_621965 [Phaeosphaeria sp. MPI-PUGE-AT-0046c]|nr:hypothetical protein DE146DRAFT_621965 [Phaeosphaeria sp. MPI-PUGE-AT-0046c]